MTIQCDKRPSRFRAERDKRSSRRGLTITEVLVSTLLVGTMLNTAMVTFAHIRRASTVESTRGKAYRLAWEMINETMSLPASSTATASPLPAQRQRFDDLRQYDGWDRSPPVDVVGNAVADDQWRREVRVDAIDSFGNPVVSGATTSPQTRARITVTVYQNQTVAAVLSQIRSFDGSRSDTPDGPSGRL